MRHVMSIDAMEAVKWGELLSFGTNKHPPLTGWLASAVYNFLGHNEVFIYILGQVCVIIGFIYIYKLAKNFLSEEKAFCSVMILQACHYYTYSVVLDNFNCNIILLAFWPAVAYYFYKGINQERTKDWITFGILTGLAFCGKYQIVFLIFALFLYLLIADRQQFRKKGIYIAFLSGLAIILPHIVWVWQHDFFCLNYMTQRAGANEIHKSLLSNTIEPIFYCTKFLADQILASLGCIAFYAFTAIQAKNIKFKNGELPRNDRIFILSIAVIPVLAQAFLGLSTAHRVPGTWGSMMLGFLGIFLFTMFPIKFRENTFKFFTGLSFFVLGGSVLAIFAFLNLQNKMYISLPYEKIFPEINQQWNLETDNAPLKYVAGDLGYIFAYRYYDKSHPEVILDTFGYKNPWANHQDILESGAIIFSQDSEELDTIAKDRIRLLPKDYQTTPKLLDYKVCNKLNSCKDYSIFYAIILPQK